MIIIVMGVSGCGKSTVASKIAERLKAAFLEADDLHPPDNKQLMSSGIPLTDENRIPWLHTVQERAVELSADQICVVACSALKKSYRDILNKDGATHYVYLEGTPEVLHQRLQGRAGHFMPESLLESQISTLEPPIGEPNVVVVSIEATPEEIADNALNALKQANYL